MGGRVWPCTGSAYGHVSSLTDHYFYDLENYILEK